MILEGVTDGGAIVPVQVTQTGRLVAEGLQGAGGPAGPAGPQGPEGPPGPSAGDLSGTDALASYWARQPWQTRSSAADNGWSSVTWAKELGLLVAVAYTGTGDRVMTSPDGINWTARSSAVDNEWLSVTWAKELGLLVAVAHTGTGNQVMTSPDGINWTARNSAADNRWFSVVWA